MTGFTSTRNHFPLQWMRQIFPQKGKETKYSEVTCCKTELHDTFITLSEEHVTTPPEKHLRGSGRLSHPHVIWGAAHAWGSGNFCTVPLHLPKAVIYAPGLHMAHKSPLLKGLKMSAWTSVWLIQALGRPVTMKGEDESDKEENSLDEKWGGWASRQ